MNNQDYVDKRNDSALFACRPITGVNVSNSSPYPTRDVLPPGPSSPPFFNMVRWVRRPLPMLEQLAATYGPAFSVRIPRMPEPLVFFSDPAAIRDIWTGDPDVLRAGEANVLLRSALGPSSLLLLDGLEHLRERRLMLPPFHGDRMRAYGDAMRDATLAELARWKHGVAFPIHGAMQTITLEVIMRTIFGVGDEPRLRPLRDALDKNAPHHLGAGAEIRSVYLVDPGVAVIDVNSAFADTRTRDRRARGASVSRRDRSRRSGAPVRTGHRFTSVSHLT